MKMINKTISITQSLSSDLEYYKHYYSEERILFVDIETTGFVAKNTTLYLIGALWYDDKSIHIRQWFNDTGYDEQEILDAFLQFCNRYTTLVHFNGCQFDLPYLSQKATSNQIPFQLDTNLYQIDLLKIARYLKKVLLLDNMKQKTVENFLGIQRDDQFSGGDLINVYQRFVASQNKELERILLLHNHDDLIGMVSLSTILNYHAFFNELSVDEIQINNTNITENQFIVEYTYPKYASLAKRIHKVCQGIYFNANEQNALLQIPLLEAELKHFFKDYKNYYYLQAEDTAIHKSIAAYVESQNRTKATKSNCYTKKTGYFVPTYRKDSQTIFQYDINDKQYYETIDTFTENQIALKDYILSMQKQLLKG